MKHFLFLIGIIALCMVPLLFDGKAPIAEGIEIHITEEERRYLEPALNAALDDVLAFYQRKHNMNLTKPQHIIFSQDSTFVADTMYNLSRPHMSHKYARSFAREFCDADQRLSGVITLNAMLMCISPTEDVSSRWARDNYAELSATLAHEIMHSLQHQLSGAKRQTVSAQSRSGPIWMVEGSANYMARDFQGATAEKRAEFERVFDRVQGSTKPLAELFNSPAYKRFEFYGVSHLAVHMLAERHGASAVFRYFEHLSNGHSWENSFARAFNIPMGDFMREFETLRRDRKAAWDWMQVTNL